MRITTSIRLATLFAFTAIAIAATACTRKPEQPELSFINIGFTLKLPPDMQHALDSLAPGFRSVMVGKYRSDIAQYAAEAGGGMQALFATIADFDGDGTLDAVVEGNTAGDSALSVIAIMNGATPLATLIARTEQYDADAVGLYLSRPKGIAPRSFELVDYPDSSTVYTYVRGRFVGKKVGD